MDLKQFILGMVTNQDGIPLFVKAHSGNASDKNTIIEAMLKIKLGLNLDDSAYYMADSALYSAANIQRLGTDIHYITRVPATLNEAEMLLNSDVEMVKCKDTRYKFFSTASNYGGIPQKWVLYKSQPMQERQDSIAEWTIRKRLRESGETILNQLKKPTQNPTFKWIAFLFFGVAEVTIWMNGERHQKVANLNDSLVKIIRLFGQSCEKYYGLKD